MKSSFLVQYIFLLLNTCTFCPYIDEMGQFLHSIIRMLRIWNKSLTFQSTWFKCGLRNRTREGNRTETKPVRMFWRNIINFCFSVFWFYCQFAMIYVMYDVGSKIIFVPMGQFWSMKTPSTNLPILCGWNDLRLEIQYCCLSTEVT